MAKTQVAPVHVRLAPDTLQAVRDLAARHGETVHAEVVRAVEAALAREGEETEIRALKVAITALADQFAWMVGPDVDEDHARLVLRLFRAAVDALLDDLGARAEASGDVKQMGEASARRVLADMKGRTPALVDPALADAGRALLRSKGQPR